MKAGADFQQTGHAAMDRYPPPGRFGDATEDLEQGGFAGAIVADDADTVPLLNLEVDVPKGPEFFDLVALDNLTAGDHVAGLADEIPGVSGHHIP